MIMLDIPAIHFLAISVLVKLSGASIAGVTYMDDFDFEQRYRNLHECDPFYWHPLHLPDECVKMFGNLIRSRIRPPYTIVKERESYIPYWPRHYKNRNSNSIEPDESYRGIPAMPIEAELIYQPRLSPLEKLFELMRRDVEENPTAPKVVSVPYFGGVALYKQPVSFKTKDMIKTISGAYAKAAYQT